MGSVIRGWTLRGLSVAFLSTAGWLIVPGQASAQLYTFTTLDNPAITSPGNGTVAYGVNNLGQIVGGYDGSTSGFLYSGGTYTNIAIPAPSGTNARGINDPGDITGQIFGNIAVVGSGFVYSGGVYTTLPVGGNGTGLHETIGFGINNAGQVVGSYLQGSGYLYSGGTFTRLQDPSASGDTTANGLNNTGQIVGSYINATSGGNQSHGFLYSGGTFTTIDANLGSQTRLNGINDSGLIVGTYDGVHSFVSMGGTFINIDNPLATGGTFAYGINNAGQIVGSYVDATGQHGFLATPVDVNIDLRGFNQTVGSLTGGGSVTNSGIASPATLTTGIDNSSTRFDGVIQDGTSATALSKVGTGTQILGGNNSYTGGTTLNAGTLAVFADNNLGASSGGLTFDGGTLKFLSSFTSSRGVTLNAGGGTLYDDVGITLGGTITGAGRLTKVANAFTILSGTNNYSGGTTISDGGLAVTNNSALGSGAVTLDGGKLVAGANGLNVTNAFFINTTGGSVETNGNTLTLSGLVADGNGAGALSKTGTGTLILTGSNTYTGGTTISDGALQINTNSSAGSGQMTFNGGTLRAGANNLTLSNAVAIGAAAGGFDTNGNTFTVSSNIVDGAGAGALAKFGTGMLVLSGTNSYSGGTTIQAGTIQATNNASLGSGRLFFEGGGLQAGANNLNLTNAIFVTSLFGDGIVDTNGYTLTLSGGISESIGGSGLTKIGLGTLALSGSNTYTGPTTINAGTLLGAAANALPRGTMTVNAGATVDLGGFVQPNLNVSLNGGTVQNGTASGFITSSGGNIRDIGGAAAVTAVSGTTLFSGSNTYTDPTRAGSPFTTGVVLLGGAANTFSPTSLAIIGFGATLDLGGFGQTINTVILENGSIRNGSLTGAVTSSGGAIRDLGGTAAVTIVEGTTTFSGANTYTGPTKAGGSSTPSALLLAGSANTFSAASATTIGARTTLDLGGFAQTINTVSLENGTIQNGLLTGALTSIGGTLRDIGGSVTVVTTSGTTTVAGNNSYTGATTVNGGILEAIGSMASSSLTVNTGAALTGAGTVGDTTIASGGTFVPGNATPGSSITVSGNLVFQSGALYLVQLTPATSTFANVTGTASLNGSAGAAFLAGSYVSKQYMILTSAGGINGTFGSFNTSALPAGFTANLSYDAHNVILNLVLSYVAPSAPAFSGGLSGNQQNVGNALINFFNSSGGIPAVFGSLTPGGLTQISGTTATGSQQNTSIAMTQFMGMMLDPSIAGRGDTPGPAGATPFAEERGNESVREAYATVDRKATLVERTFAQRWSVWASAYGGSQTTDGNASSGTSSATSRIIGTAAGADYHFSPFTSAGFALAGGGTSFGVANGLGSGRSDLFQAGAFIRHAVGAAYASAALAYGWQDVTTDRTVTVAGVDRLRAQFKANSWSGRVEGGYRFVTTWMGLTPYAAGQVATFQLPAYAEQVVSGANTFALGYGAKITTATRSELGLRTDKSFAGQSAILTLRGRAAWAHDFNTDRSVLATFQTLPGASFVTNGPKPARDAALTTASAELNWLNGFSLAGTFEGEFSNVTRSYAGKGVAKYSW